jgi:hypothetical protein
VDCADNDTTEHKSIAINKEVFATEETVFEMLNGQYRVKSSKVLIQQ